MKIRTLTASNADNYILNAILNDPSVRNGVAEDSTPELHYTLSDFPVTFLATVDDRPVGLILTRQNSRHDIDAHICFLEPGHAVRAAKECIEMLCDYWDWRVITCRYPATSKGVTRLIEHLDFVKAGTIPECYASSGRLVDMNIYYRRR